MDYKSLIQSRRADFEAIIEQARIDISGIRTGRANASMLDEIRIEYMGGQYQIKELASITSPEPRVLAIQPWDKAVIPIIAKAIRESHLNLNPVDDGTVVRLTVPPLTEERRKEFVKTLGQKAEDARIRSRHIREDVLKKVQSEVKAKTAREDDLYRAKDELQKVMDDFNKKLDEVVKKKEQELMSA